MSGRVQTLLATARIANVPSVVSNVCVGAAAALMAGTDVRGLALIATAGVCLYLAGNFLNDWADRDWDARHRPERALPRRLFPPALYLATAAACLLLGMGLAAAANPCSLPVAAAIVALVLFYTAIHKRSAWSVIPMGLCRALLPLLGFLGCAGDLPAFGSRDLAWCLAPGLALFCYVAGLSLSARNESAGHASLRWVPPLLFVLAGFAAAAPACWIAAASKALGGVADFTGLIVAATAFSLWTLFCNTWARKPVSRHVSNLLAGIPLVDWIFILPVVGAMEETRAIEGGHSLIWVPPLAFLMGKVLQRLAPAT